jgi:predicted ATP-grasp superfamily ATP-dependent carboligase
LAGAEQRVLVLDAQLRHAIAIVRALGRRGIEVVGAGTGRRFPSSFSRYMSEAVSFDADDPTAAADDLLAIVQRHRIGVVLAAGLPGNRFLCRHRAELEPRVRAPFNDLEAFERLSNKAETAKLADSLGVSRPRAIDLRDAAQAGEAIGTLGTPVVFKSPLDQGTVRYAHDEAQLRTLIERFRSRNPELQPLAQEYVQGAGHGFYGLADRGELLGYFMHRRLHEFPPTGGPSAMAAGDRDPELLDLGCRFLSATGWSGVAMVEFKKSREDGRYHLIEVNPKFWGSLELSIASGVDFPLLLHRMLAGEPLEHTPGNYREGVVFRWLTMDLAYAVATRRVRTYFRTFWDGRVLDDFARDDPLPSAALMLKGAGQFMRASRSEAEPG